MKKRTAIFSMAFIALVLFGSGCDAAERDTATEPAITASPTVTPMITPEPSPSPATSPGAPEWLADGATHSVAGITGAPKALIGKTVTVVAEVEEVYDSRAFELDGGASLTGGVKEDLLALIPKVGGFPIIDEQWKDSRARVTGVLQWMAPKNVEREIGWELPRSLEIKFKGRPVLIARSVERLVR
ncbi:MAG: hypothetical protein MOB07_15145 [Acidobacteria bacterium]|nr:hypothetical protein [Acidobacteriota bacterium]